MTFISVSPNLQEGLDPSPPSPPRGQAASLRKPPTKEPRTACIKTATNPPLGNYEPLHLGLETGRLNVNSVLMVHIIPYELRKIPTHSPIQCCLETNSVKGNVFSRSWSIRDGCVRSEHVVPQFDGQGLGYGILMGLMANESGRCTKSGYAL